MKSVLLSVLVISFSITTWANGIFPARKSPVDLRSHFQDGVGKKASDYNVVYFGGPVLSHVQVVAVFWGPNVDKNVQSKIGPFFKAVTNSTYLDWLQEYNTNINSVDGRKGTAQNIGRGILAGSVTIMPADARTVLDKLDVEAEIEKQISQNVLPKPSADTLYMIYFPPGIKLTTGGIASCEQWCGDHEGFTSQKFGNIYYAMMPDFSGICQFSCGSFSGTRFDSMTLVSSHELIESITDPMCPNINAVSAYPAAWLSTAEEIGDLCTDSTGFLQSGATIYQLQGEWDKDAQVCKGGSFTSP